MLLYFPSECSKPRAVDCIFQFSIRYPKCRYESVHAGNYSRFSFKFQVIGIRTKTWNIILSIGTRGAATSGGIPAGSRPSFCGILLNLYSSLLCTSRKYLVHFLARVCWIALISTFTNELLLYNGCWGWCCSRGNAEKPTQIRGSEFFRRPSRWRPAQFG